MTKPVYTHLPSDVSNLMHEMDCQQERLEDESRQLCIKIRAIKEEQINILIDNIPFVWTLIAEFDKRIKHVGYFASFESAEYFMGRMKSSNPPYKIDHAVFFIKQERSDSHSLYEIGKVESRFKNKNSGFENVFSEN